MPYREQDNLPYSTPGTLQRSAEPTSQNEQEFSTLKIVGNILNDALAGLSRDFNAFDVLKDADRAKAADNMLRQVEAKQMAYDILLPCVEAVTSAIQIVDSKYKQ